MILIPIIFLSLLGLLAGSADASADLVVQPTRVVLSDNQKTAQIAIRNERDRAVRVRIDAVPFRVRPDGKLEQYRVEEKGERSALRLFRFSPRAANLSPNAEEVVRLMRFPSESEPSGEYRAHLVIESLDGGGGASGVVTIIVRKGPSELSASLANLEYSSPKGPVLSHAPAILSAVLELKGNRSYFGDLIVLNLPADGSETKIVERVSSYVSYLPQKKITLPLIAKDLVTGILRLEVREPVAEGGKVLASAEVSIKK